MPNERPKILNPRKTPRQARSEATVEAIFDATIQVLLLHGARRLTTTRVAERAGVSVGTMYQYFPHKESLLYALVGRYLEQVAEAVEEACQQNLGQPLAIGCDALVSAYVLAKSKNAEASRALYSASSEFGVANLVRATFKRFHDAASRLLKNCPDVQFDDPDEVAFSLIAALTGATRVAFEDDARRETLDDFRHHMITMCRSFLQSVAVEPSTPASQSSGDASEGSRKMRHRPRDRLRQ
jgi:AcrR family transcriptional regulator